MNWARASCFDQTLKIIKTLSPDLLFLQEVDVNRPASGGIDQPKLIAGEVGGTSFFSSRLDLEGGQYGLAVVTRFPAKLLGSETCHLRASGEKTLFMNLSVDYKGRDVRCATVHAGHGIPERRRVFDGLIKAIPRDYPVILGGDLNTTPWSPLFRRFASDHSELNRVKHHPTWPGFFPLVQIDHLFYSNHFRPSESGAFKSKLNRFSSDHLPLSVDLEWNEN